MYGLQYIDLYYYGPNSNRSNSFYFIFDGDNITNRVYRNIYAARVESFCVAYHSNNMSSNSIIRPPVIDPTFTPSGPFIAPNVTPSFIPPSSPSGPSQGPSVEPNPMPEPEDKKEEKGDGVSINIKLSRTAVIGIMAGLAVLLLITMICCCYHCCCKDSSEEYER